MKVAVLVMLAFVSIASAQWSDTLHAVTSGEFDDINPQADHAGMAPGIIGGYYGSSLKGEWLVFERWSGGSDAIAGVRFFGPSLRWDTTADVISASRAGVVQKYPDVCTVGNGTSLAAWQEQSDGAWNIEYSICSIDSGNWSVPVALTGGCVNNTNAEVRPLSDSSFVLLWRKGEAIVCSVYKSGGFSQIDTLVVTNTDSTEYDFAGNQFIWSMMGKTGIRFCLLSTVGNSGTFALSAPDTIRSDGDIGRPRFMINHGETEKSLTFNLLSKGLRSVWLFSTSTVGPFIPEELASEDSIDYLNAVFYGPPYIVASLSKTTSPYQLYPTNFYAWEKRTGKDTSVIFYSAGDSVQKGSNPCISSISFSEGDAALLNFVVWQSHRTGKSHIYSRSFLWTNTAIHEPPEPATNFRLDQNYPDPFNPTTAISYELSANSYVTLRIYDVLGRELATLVDGRQSAGAHSVVFNGSRYASGVYFYRLTAPGVSIVKKMLLEK